MRRKSAYPTRASGNPVEGLRRATWHLRAVPFRSRTRQTQLDGSPIHAGRYRNKPSHALQTPIQNTMNKSDNIEALSKALCAAQAEMKNPKMESANPFFKSKYASLAEVRNTVTPVLASNKLAVLQLPQIVD